MRKTTLADKLKRHILNDLNGKAKKEKVSRIMRKTKEQKAIDRLSEELWKVIDKYIDKEEISTAAYIGVLELIKNDIYHNANDD